MEWWLVLPPQFRSRPPLDIQRWLVDKLVTDRASAWESFADNQQFLIPDFHDRVLTFLLFQVILLTFIYLFLCRGFFEGLFNKDVNREQTTSFLTWVCAYSEVVVGCCCASCSSGTTTGVLCTRAKPTGEQNLFHGPLWHRSDQLETSLPGHRFFLWTVSVHPSQPKTQLVFKEYHKFPLDIYNSLHFNAVHGKLCLFNLTHHPSSFDIRNDSMNLPH